jgi:hypothetical protein
VYVRVKRARCVPLDVRFFHLNGFSDLPPFVLTFWIISIRTFLTTGCDSSRNTLHGERGMKRKTGTVTSINDYAGSVCKVFTIVSFSKKWTVYSNETLRHQSVWRITSDQQFPTATDAFPWETQKPAPARIDTMAPWHTPLITQPWDLVLDGPFLVGPIYQPVCPP